jgi:capsular exopolysaccharide synthesis family protein
MSRIHDALKKAQQERSGSSSSADESAWQAIDEMPGMSGRPAAVLDSPEIGRVESPGKGAPMGVEVLLARCRQNQWNPDPEALLFSDSDGHPAAREVFRTLRTRLYQIRSVQPLLKVLVTSPLPGDGKTFVASNLAQSIVRQRERRVLLIDGDLRISRLHERLGAPCTPGLSEYLLGESDELSVMQRGREDNLFLIAGGKTPSNPTELLGNGRLETLLARLTPAFDWILIDSPPAVPVSDASILAKQCDGVLMVVRAGATPFDLAQKACQEFRDKPVVGAVLNRAEFRASYGGYDYGKYGYTPESTEDTSRS